MRRKASIYKGLGVCAHGVSSSGGVGKAIARWIVTGDAGLDLSAMSLARFGAVAPDKAAIARGACEVYSTYYDIPGSSSHV